MLGLKLNHVSKRGHWLQISSTPSPTTMLSGLWHCHTSHIMQYSNYDHGRLRGQQPTYYAILKLWSWEVGGQQPTYYAILKLWSWEVEGSANYYIMQYSNYDHGRLGVSNPHIMQYSNYDHGRLGVSNPHIMQYSNYDHGRLGVSNHWFVVTFGWFLFSEK